MTIFVNIIINITGGYPSVIFNFLFSNAHITDGFFLSIKLLSTDVSHFSVDFLRVSSSVAYLYYQLFLSKKKKKILIKLIPYFKFKHIKETFQMNPYLKALPQV